MIRQYINAINNGAVPNIESSWNYICKDECMKAQEQAIDYFKKNINDLIYDKIPTTDEEIRVNTKLLK